MCAPYNLSAPCLTIAMIPLHIYVPISNARAALRAGAAILWLNLPLHPPAHSPRRCTAARPPLSPSAFLICTILLFAPAFLCLDTASPLLSSPWSRPPKLGLMPSPPLCGWWVKVSPRVSYPTGSALPFSRTHSHSFSFILHRSHCYETFLCCSALHPWVLHGGEICHCVPTWWSGIKGQVTYC